MISVFIVESDHWTGRGLFEVLRPVDFVDWVAWETHAAVALPRVVNSKPDVVLVGIHMHSEPAKLRLPEFCSLKDSRTLLLFWDNQESLLLQLVHEYSAKVLTSPISESTLLAAIKNPAAAAAAERTNRLSLHLSASDVATLSCLATGMRYHEIANVRRTTTETIRKQCDKMRIKLGLASREQLICWACNNGFGNGSTTALAQYR